MVRIVARKGSRNNISMHHNAMDLALIQPQLIEYLLAAAEHERRSKSDDRPESRRLDNLTGQQHQVDQERQASPKRMPCELKLCSLSVLVQVFDYFGHELRIYSLCSFINPSMNKTFCFLHKEISHKNISNNNFWCFYFCKFTSNLVGSKKRFACQEAKESEPCNANYN